MPAVSMAEATVVDQDEAGSCRLPGERTGDVHRAGTADPEKDGGGGKGSKLADKIVTEIPHLRRYAGFLTRSATEGQDLVQDCLERALRCVDQFQEGTEVRRWLFTILRNLFIDGKRKEVRRNRQLPFIDRDCLTSLSPQYFHLRLKEVEAAIRELRPCEQEAIYLSLVVGLDQRTIARQMNIAVGTVKSRLSRARQKLRQED